MGQTLTLSICFLLMMALCLAAAKAVGKTSKSEVTTSRSNDAQIPVVDGSTDRRNRSCDSAERPSKRSGGTRTANVKMESTGTSTGVQSSPTGLNLTGKVNAGKEESTPKQKGTPAAASNSTVPESRTVETQTNSPIVNITERVGLPHIPNVRVPNPGTPVPNPLGFGAVSTVPNGLVLNSGTPTSLVGSNAPYMAPANGMINMFPLLGGNANAFGTGSGSIGNGQSTATGTASAGAGHGGFSIAVGIGATFSTPFGNFALSNGQSLAIGL